MSLSVYGGEDNDLGKLKSEAWYTEKSRIIKLFFDALRIFSCKIMVGIRNCQSAFKFDPPCASKNDPPQVFVFKGTSGGFGEGGGEERWSAVAGSHVRHTFDVRLETDVLSYYPLPLRKKESRMSRTAWPPKYLWLHEYILAKPDAIAD